MNRHPDSACQSVTSLNVEVRQQEGSNLALRFMLTGDISKLNIPQKHPSERTDGLWHTTCFELFIRKPETSAYLEYNFSPSSRWAAYRFAGYREGMAELTADTPKIGLDMSETHFTLDTELMLPVEYWAEKLQLGLSVIVEETDGAKSYWALAHPPGPPDFHHRDCFALQLEAPRRP
ncbi:MAG: DOMON-like domain-containing protein [Sphingorhabdus sp.]